MASLYENILPLSEVKNHLRIDDDYTDDDSAIERMVNSAFGFIERQTNYIFRTQDKEYFSNENEIEVYDYPINTTDFPEGVYPMVHSGKVVFCQNNISLNVGFTSRELAEQKVPELIEAALNIIEQFYYKAEKSVDNSVIDDATKDIININRRFLIC